MIDFDLRQLEYFVCAARTGSYSAAARELYVTPQAISRSIQLLEARIGMKLFRRTGGGITLTNFGEAVLEPARKALDAIEEVQGTAARFRQDVSATIVMGVHSLCFRENGGSIDRNELLSYQRERGLLSLSIIEMNGNAILDSLRHGSLDIGVSVPSRTGGDAFGHRPLKRFSVAALVSKHFPGHFAPAREWVSIEELTAGELVLFTEETEYNDFLIEQARLEGRELPISPLRISPHGDMGFLAGTQRYVIRPVQHARRTVHDDRLRILPVRNACGEEIQMPLEVLTKRGHVVSPAEEDLMAFVEGCYR